MRGALLRFGVAAAIAIALVVWLWVRVVDQRALDAAMLPRELLPVEREAVTEIELDNPHGSFTLVRGEDGWELERPLRTLADESAVTALLDAATEATRELDVGEAPDAETLALWGLAPPRYRLRLRTATGLHELLAGERNDLNDLVYVIGEGTEVPALTSAALLYQLDRTFLQLRDKRLLVLAPQAVEALDVRLEDGTRYALRRVDGVWRLGQGSGDALADPERVDSLLTALGNLRARRFVTEAPADPNGDAQAPHPSMEVEVRHRSRVPGASTPTTPTTSTTSSMQLWRSGDAAYAALRGGPQIELASGSVLEQLAVDPAALRDQRLLHFERAAVHRLTLASEEGVLVLDRSSDPAPAGPNAWRVVTPAAPPRVAKDSEVFALLFRLWSLEAREVVAEGLDEAALRERGLGDRVARVELHGAQGELVAALRLGPVAGADRMVAALPGGRVARVPLTALSRLDLAPSAYVDEGH